MKTFILILLSLFIIPAYALSVSDLKSGDVLLISLNCYECRMIESETNSLFSHSGVVVIDEKGQTRVAQSLGRLAHFSFAEFTKNLTPGSNVHVYRPIELKKLSSEKRSQLEKAMLDIFNEKFKDAPFDSKYLWSNFHSSGVEYLYCSEFIAKFLDHFLSKKTIPTPISYKKHYDYWKMYFRGQPVPDGELGNSPAAFSRDDRFEFVGKI
ncbi:MAG: hypothetical protein K2Q18_14390 [Bdellovibrionales bacterium]|nr:hypothetical protein [Bdellovibrionales bacterium]